MSKIKAKERQTVFYPNFLEDLAYWVKTQKSVALKILDLVEAVSKDPFSGIGKPEPIKYESPGQWSRRITQEHRLVYVVEDKQIHFLQARYHY